MAEISEITVWQFRVAILVWSAGTALTLPGVLFQMWNYVWIGLPIMFIGGALVHLATRKLMREQ